MWLVRTWRVTLTRTKMWMKKNSLWDKCVKIVEIHWNFGTWEAGSWLNITRALSNGCHVNWVQQVDGEVCSLWTLTNVPHSKAGGNGTINHFLLYSPKIEAIKLEAATFSHLNIYLCLAAYSYQVKKLFGFNTSQNFIEGKLVPQPLFAMVLTDDDKHWFHEKSQPQAL